MDHLPCRSPRPLRILGTLAAFYLCTNQFKARLSFPFFSSTNSDLCPYSHLAAGATWARQKSQQCSVPLWLSKSRYAPDREGKREN